MPTDRAPSKKGGRGLCAACAHPQQPLINSELAAGTSLRSLSTRFGISRTALKNHKTNHLSPALIAVHSAGGAGDVLEQLRDLVSRARRFLESAELAGNSQQGLGAIRELRETLGMIAHATGELEPSRSTAAIDLVSSVEWIELRTAVVAALEPYPAAKQAVAKRLVAIHAGKNGAAK